MRSTRPLNALRRYRLLHEPQLTQRELALCLKVLQTLISRYERGRAVPSLYRAFQLAIVLRTPVEKLFPALYEQAADNANGILQTIDISVNDMNIDFNARAKHSHWI